MAKNTESGFSFYPFLFASLIIHTLFIVAIFLSSNTDLKSYLTESLKPSHKLLLALPTFTIIILFSIFLSNLIPQPPNKILTHLCELPPIKFIITIFLLTIIGPIVEELFFRLALFDATRSHLLTAILFALAHSNLPSIPIYFCISLLLSHLRTITNSLLPSILTHILYNSTVLILAFFA